MTSCFSCDLKSHRGSMVTDDDDDDALLSSSFRLQKSWTTKDLFPLRLHEWFHKSLLNMTATGLRSVRSNAGTLMTYWCTLFQRECERKHFSFFLFCLIYTVCNALASGTGTIRALNDVTIIKRHINLQICSRKIQKLLLRRSEG